MLGVGMFVYLQWVGYPDARQRMGSTGLAPDDGVGLFPPWYASRELLLKGRDPYSSEIAAEIQQRVYGRPALVAEASLSRDEHRFAYPLYVSLLLAPLVWLPFEQAQVVIIVALAAVTAASVVWWLKGLGVTASRRWTLLGVLAIFGSLAVQQGLHLQQLGMMVAALLAAAVASSTAGKHYCAGALLGLATMKPHLAAGVTAWMLLWSVGDLRARRGVLVGFAGTMAVLLGGAALLVPDWITRWMGVVMLYPDYTGSQSLVGAMFGKLGAAVSMAAVAALVYTWWRWRKTESASADYRRVLLITIGVQMLLIPTWIGHNQVLLVPIALIAAMHAPQLWASGVWSRAVLAMCVATVAWERLTAAALSLLKAAGMLQSPAPAVVALPVYPLFLFPFLALLLVVVYTRASEPQAATK
jgi:hypothetical protein